MPIVPTCRTDEPTLLFSRNFQSDRREKFTVPVQLQQSGGDAGERFQPVMKKNNNLALHTSHRENILWLLHYELINSGHTLPRNLESNLEKNVPCRLLPAKFFFFSFSAAVEFKWPRRRI